MRNVSLEEVLETYGVENWGAGYFEVNRQGHLAVRPAEGDPRSVDVKALIDDLIEHHKLQLPILLRFPQILTNQLKKLHRAFQEASREFSYNGGHFGVFPMKVNPRREVVEEFLREGSKYNFGVECGSKAELYAALSLEQTPESLLVCNGFKDEAFVNLALLGVQIGKQVVIVVEKLNELKMIIRRSQETGVRPWIGMRAKLYSKGSGKWASSGGESAKFGLTTSEMLECIRLLREFEMTDSLKLLHFHIGSQITDIKRVKNGDERSGPRLLPRFARCRSTSSISTSAAGWASTTTARRRRLTPRSTTRCRSSPTTSSTRSSRSATTRTCRSRIWSPKADG